MTGAAMPAAATMDDLRFLRVDQVGGLSCPPDLRGVYDAYKQGQASASDLERAEKCDNGHYWPMIPLLRAHFRARLGRLEEALADCERVPYDYLLPGFGPEVPASRQQVLAEIETLRQARS